MSALAIRDHEALVSPSPLFRGSHMVQALKDYRELQTALDESMPDQLMTLDGRPFRKKGYWRAIAVAFNLTVEPTTDPQHERSMIGHLDDESENYVYTVSYRATAPNGRSAIGDGACAAAEKQRGRMKATEHNVRSHAHTRAFNRAVSNLVGFGEVSAEEVDRDDHHHEEQQRPRPAPSGDGSTLIAEVKAITAKSGKVFWVVKFDDGREGSVFKQDMASAAEKARIGKARVIPIIEKKGEYKNLLSLTPAALVAKDGPVEEAQQRWDDEVRREHSDDEIPF